MKHHLATILTVIVTVMATISLTQYLALGIPQSEKAPPREDTRLFTDKIVITTPITEPVPEQPVVIQIEHQGFPFDVDGNFPYVVTIDNTVYRYDKKIVADFLQHAVWYEDKLGEEEKTPRPRKVTTN